MTRTKSTRRICEARNDLQEFRLQVISMAPGLAEVLDQLDAGKSPSPLEVLQAISEGVEYLTGSRELPDAQAQVCEQTSARVCSAC